MHFFNFVFISVLNRPKLADLKGRKFIDLCTNPELHCIDDVPEVVYNAVHKLLSFKNPNMDFLNNYESSNLQDMDHPPTNHSEYLHFIIRLSAESPVKLLHDQDFGDRCK